MAAEQPELQVEGLLLRPFTLADAVSVQALAGDQRIADTTDSIPHPYPDGEAERWIGSQSATWEAGTHVAYAITLADSGELVGAVSLMDIAQGSAELGYWVGAPYWGRGIAGAAAGCLVEYARLGLGLRRIHARALSRNPASCKVLLRTGFTHLESKLSVCGYQRREQSTEYYELRY